MQNGSLGNCACEGSSTTLLFPVRLLSLALLIGGATLAYGGYVALGFVLAGAAVLSAALVLRVNDPLVRESPETAVAAGSEVRS